MKKRSKLDLTPDPGKEKSQASGFSSEIPLDPEKSAAPDPDTKTESSDQRAGVDTQRSQHVTDATAIRAPSRAMLAISVAVVAVAAISWFMLKRR